MTLDTLTHTSRSTVQPTTATQCVSTCGPQATTGHSWRCWCKSSEGRSALSSSFSCTRISRHRHCGARLPRLLFRANSTTNSPTNSPRRCGARLPRPVPERQMCGRGRGRGKRMPSAGRSAARLPRPLRAADLPRTHLQVCFLSLSLSLCLSLSLSIYTFTYIHIYRHVHIHIYRRGARLASSRAST